MIFDEALSRSYDDWFQTPSGRYIDAREKAFILSLMSPRPGERLLDVGCGTGEHLRMFHEKGCEVAGLDASPFMIARAREKLGSRAELHEGSAEDLPFSDNAFDHVVLITALEFTEDPALAVSEAIRVCRNRVFFGLLNPYSLLAVQRGLEGRLRDTVYNRARLLTLRKLSGMIRDRLGATPLTWGSVILFPASWYPAAGMLEERLPAVKNPFGAFMGLSFPMRFRYRTVQDAIRDPFKMKANQHNPMHGAVREMER
ncbi:MAG TPA: class I SAM-dependent methyltransferase [Syntrophus sp. (in: bacteria)]|nr:class I SAM-dependent methyltransferase [Syntrophus sp. (in: bacteria)]